MKRLLCMCGLAVATLAVAVLVAGPAGAQDPKDPPSIKEIMKQLHKGEGAALPAAKAALAASPTDWEAVTKAAGPLVTLGDALGKNETPKGEQASFEKLSKDYYKEAVILADAAKAKNLSAAQGAVGKLGMSCGACHKDHKP